MNIIKGGLKLDLLDTPFQNNCKTHPLSILETNIIKTEIVKLLHKRIIIPSHPEIGDFISGVFTRPKKDGSNRIIFNL